MILNVTEFPAPVLLHFLHLFLSQTSYTQPASKVATVIGAASPDILSSCKPRFKLLKLCDKNIIQRVIGLIRPWHIILGTR